MNATTFSYMDEFIAAKSLERLMHEIRQIIDDPIYEALKPSQDGHSHWDVQPKHGKARNHRTSLAKEYFDTIHLLYGLATQCRGDEGMSLADFLGRCDPYLFAWFCAIARHNSRFRETAKEIGLKVKDAEMTYWIEKEIPNYKHPATS